MLRSVVKFVCASDFCPPLDSYRIWAISASLFICIRRSFAAMPGNSNIPCEYIWQAFNRLCPLTERNLIRNRLIKEFCGIATDDEKKQNHKKFPPQMLHQRCGRPPVVETASRYRSNVNRLAVQLYNVGFFRALYSDFCIFSRQPCKSHLAILTKTKEMA